jgi:hypothetical protein
MEFENENINDRQLNTRAQLEQLSKSDYEIMDGEPDITGWNVLSQSGDKLGEVEDLLFDPQARKVRYLIVQLQANGDDIPDDKYILVPIGVAQLHSEEDEVLLPGRSAAELYHLPAYESGTQKPEDEVQIRQVFEGAVRPLTNTRNSIRTNISTKTGSTAAICRTTIPSSRPKTLTAPKK